jgi:hypothetical protein
VDEFAPIAILMSGTCEAMAEGIRHGVTFK